MTCRRIVRPAYKTIQGNRTVCSAVCAEAYGRVKVITDTERNGIPMGMTIAHKIIASHLVGGEMTPGSEIALKIDQTLTQDATGTMAYLQFEAMGIDRVKTELSVAYIDHNTLQNGFENADDHRYIQTVAKKHGLRFSRPGNGICHQVHLERFGIPGKTLIGSDSHTPTGGGIGMLAFGAGGLTWPWRWAAARTASKCRTFSASTSPAASRRGSRPRTLFWNCCAASRSRAALGRSSSNTAGRRGDALRPRARDHHEYGRRAGRHHLRFPGGRGHARVYEGAGSGGGLCSRRRRRRRGVRRGRRAGPFPALRPLAACPHSPDNVKPVSELGEIKIDQVCIGSCTNSSLCGYDEGRRHPQGKPSRRTCRLAVAPGSKQVFQMLAANGALADIIAAGARVLGMRLRALHRDGAVAQLGGRVAAHLQPQLHRPQRHQGRGRLSRQSRGGRRQRRPRRPHRPATTCGACPRVAMPEAFLVNDNMIELPAAPAEAASLTVERGPNIKPFPLSEKLPDAIEKTCILKVGDNITTDHIMPAGSKILPYRSNIPYLSKFCFAVCDESFPERAKAAGGGIVVGGSNYGQGSREHAALSCRCIWA